MTAQTDLTEQLRRLWTNRQMPSDAKAEDADRAVSEDTRAAGKLDADFMTWPSDWLDNPKRREPPPWCRLYAHPTAWRSVFGAHLICGTCHPPVSDAVVAEWIDENSREGT